MKRTTNALMAALIITLGLAGCGIKYNWEEYSSTECDYKILMPGEIKTKILPTFTMAGTMTNHISMVETNNAVFVVSCTEFPEGIPIDLEAGIEGDTKDFNEVEFDYKKVHRVEWIHGQGVPFHRKGRWRRRFSVDRIFSVDNKLYQIFVTGEKGKASNKNVKTFFNSFELM